MSLVNSKNLDGFQTQIKARQHYIVADEPIELGGSDTAPTPLEYLTAALASCTSITLQMYANRKGWKLDSIEVEAQKVEAGFHRRIVLGGDLDQAQRQRLLQVANACPIHKIISASNTIETEMQAYGNTTN